MICIPLLVSFLVLAKAYPEHGMSAAITVDKDYQSKHWQKIDGWNIKNTNGQYLRGLNLDGTKSSVTVKKPGIYFVSFHMLLTNLIGEDVNMAVIVNNDIAKGLAIHSTIRVHYKTSLSASGFLRLRTGDIVTIYGNCQKLFKICRDSSFIIRYHDNPTSVPGFLFILNEPHQITASNNLKVLSGWATRDYGQFASASIFREGQSMLQIPITGVYMLCANIILTILDKSSKIEVHFYVSNIKVSSIYEYMKPVSTITINLYEMFYLQAGSKVRIEVFVAESSRINVVSTSSWSMLLVKSNILSANGFHAKLQKSYSKPGTNKFLTISSWVPHVNKIGDFQAHSTSEIVHEKSFSTEVSGIFYVTATLTFTIEQNKTESENNLVTVALSADSFLFKQTRLYTRSQSINNINDTFINQTYTVSIIGVFQLLPSTPINVVIKSENVKTYVFYEGSSYSVVEILSTYPGVHSQLKTLKRINNAPPLEDSLLGNWKTQGSEGLFDYTDNFNKSSGFFTATTSGVYITTANINFEDIDDHFFMAIISKEFSQDILTNIYVKDGNTLQTMSVSLGGFVSLKEKQTLALYVQGKGDTDWKILPSTGMSIAYLGTNPIYFLARLNEDVTIPNTVLQVSLKSWEEMTDGNLLNTNGGFKVPHSGIYFTTVNVILSEAQSISLDSYYKIYLAINGIEIKGLYSKRESGVVYSQRPVYTLFFSGSFYAQKDSIITTEIELGKKSTFSVDKSSKWGIAFMQSLELASGALAVTNSQIFYRNVDVWQDVLNDKWKYSHNKYDGSFESSRTLIFDNSINVINILEEGMYLISVNLEVGYSHSEPTVLKLAVVINENDELSNGLSAHQTTLWKKHTLHICGTIFLKRSDKIRIRLSTTKFDKTTILAGSGLSVVLVPEAKPSSTFTVTLKNNIKINYFTSVLSDWDYVGFLSSPSLNINTGETIITDNGYYALSAILPFKNINGSDNTVILNVNINGVDIKTCEANLNATTTYIKIEETLQLKTFDALTFTVTLVNTSLVHDKYLLFMNSSNQASNHTEINPYEIFNVLLQKEGSTLSLVYMPNFAPISGWKGTFVVNKSFTEIGKNILLSPWVLPTNHANDGRGEIDTTVAGMYSLSSKIKVSNQTGNVEISFSKNLQHVCSSRQSCSSTCEATFTIYCFAFIERSVEITMSIIADQPGMIVQQNSERIINLVAEKTTGFFVSLNNDILVNFTSNVWQPIGLWSSNTSLYGLFAYNVEIYQYELLVRESGTFRVACNVQLCIRSPCDQSCIKRIELSVFLNGKLQLSLHGTNELSAGVNTINLIGNIAIQKWDKLTLNIKAPINTSLQILKKTAWSAVLVESSPFSRVEELGPVLMSTLTPKSYQNFKIGVQKSWFCKAYGDGDIIYKWYKNNTLYLIENTTSSVLTIIGMLNDTGTYHCVAVLYNLEVPSNKVVVNIYDVDECKLGLDDCSKGATCSNTPGSFACKCNKGFSGTGKTCSDADECLTPNICAYMSACRNLPGRHQCYCPDGYVSPDAEKYNCSDIDECSPFFNLNTCDPNHGVCTNTNGSFNCSCESGWLLNGTICTEINECETGNYTCDQNSKCNNLNGTYECTCNEGWQKDGEKCIDVNECLPQFNEKRRADGKCVNDSSCVNTGGSYTCVCKDGFTGNGTVKCTDIDECSKKPCNSAADCLNQPGTYKCVCREGWIGDGYQCADEDECKLSANKCKNGNCTNTVGSYYCKCNTGYRANGDTCVETNSPPSFSKLTACQKDKESFQCLCNDAELRSNNIMCNGLFVALIILVLVAIVVIIFIVKYIKTRKLMKIRPARTRRDKYVEMQNESEL